MPAMPLPVRDVRFPVYVSEALKLELIDLAEDDERTLSHYCARVLEAHVRERRRQRDALERTVQDTRVAGAR